MFYTRFFNVIEETMNNIDYSELINLLDTIMNIRSRKGRIFFLGNGG